MNRVCPLVALTLVLLVPALLLGGSREVRKLKGHQGSVLSVAFSPDGTILASGSGGPEALVWLWPMARTRPERPGHSLRP